MNFLKYILVERRIASVIYIIGAAMVWGDGSIPAMIWGNMMLLICVMIHLRQTADHYRQIAENEAKFRLAMAEFSKRRISEMHVLRKA